MTFLCKFHQEHEFPLKCQASISLTNLIFATCQKCICPVGRGTRATKERSSNEGSNYGVAEQQHDIGETQPATPIELKQNRDILGLARPIQSPRCDTLRQLNVESTAWLIAVTFIINLLLRSKSQRSTVARRSTMFHQQLPGSDWVSTSVEILVGYWYCKRTRYFDQCQSFNVSTRDSCMSRSQFQPNSATFSPHQPD